MKGKNTAKEHYQQLRELSCEQLWREHVPAFESASPRERVQQVAVVRAVGVVFAASGTAQQKEQARQWLRQLLKDPEEKVRRYAMVALPKIGADETEETALHSLLKNPASDREKKFLGRALEKIGGAATLEISGSHGALGQKIGAKLARQSVPTSILMDRGYADFAELRINLRCRAGLEPILEEELKERCSDTFRFIHASSGLVSVTPLREFKLAYLSVMRCFHTASIVLGTVPTSKDDETGQLADIISSPDTQELLETFTDGPIRYRLDFVSKGHQRSAVRSLASEVYERNPALLNDSHDAPWAINIHHTPRGTTVELAPRLRPDPRFTYRQQDVPAASHPPLAACMARLAGKWDREIVWDPFCGSGLELIERALLGGVQQIIGTDRSAEAIATTKTNLATALEHPIKSTFAARDFREYARGEKLSAISLIVTNPPMGRRVPIPNLGELIEDLFSVASAVLQPGGRLVFANPLPIEPKDRSLKLQSRQKVDLGGFHCHLEKYIKSGGRRADAEDKAVPHTKSTKDTKARQEGNAFSRFRK